MPYDDEQLEAVLSSADARLQTDANLQNGGAMLDAASKDALRAWARKNGPWIAEKQKAGWGEDEFSEALVTRLKGAKSVSALLALCDQNTRC